MYISIAYSNMAVVEVLNNNIQVFSHMTKVLICKFRILQNIV